MSNLGVVFHIWCKRLDLFWSVRGKTSKIPTYPTSQLAPLSPTFSFIGTFQAICSKRKIPNFIVPSLGY
jgi:hypothetical protein